MINPVAMYRVYRWLFVHKIPKLPRFLQRINYWLTGCDLPPTAQIGRRPQMPHHGAGVILNNNVVIGDDVTIMPHVLIGQNVRGDTPVPAEIVVKDRAMLGAGAKIIASGYLEIGEGASVGANAVVLSSVPAGAIAVGIPARIIQAGDRGAAEAPPA